MANLFQELKRRNVFRVAGLYLVVSWLLLQVASLLEGALKLPDWFDGTFAAMVGLGFPVALILAWAFELTPDGVRPTAESETPTPTRPVDWVLVSLLTVVAGLLIWGRVDPPLAHVAVTADGKDTVAAAPSQSVAVAVMPFSDLSPEGDQDYFSDGLAEELLNVLAREASIRVAGRTSSFAFKGKNADVKTIAQALQVSHVLEGSVRKAGERIRVSASLLDGRTGFPVFTQSYDRKLEDIFAVQDDIAKRIGRALEIRLTLSNRGTPPDPGAYEKYLTARELIYTRTLPNMRKAESLLETAQALAPEYAPIRASRAVVTMLLSNMNGGYGEREAAVELPRAKVMIDRALALDPELAEAHAALGLYLDSVPGGGEDSAPALERALELNPNLTQAMLWLANTRPDLASSVALLERLVERDPGFLPAASNLAGRYGQRGQYDRARAVLDRAAAVLGESAVRSHRANIELVAGNVARAYELAKANYAAFPGDRSARLIFAFASLHIGDFDRAEEVGGALGQAAVAWTSGRDDRALNVVEKAPRDSFIAEVAVPLFVALERYEDAVDYFESVHGKPTHYKQMNNVGSAAANALRAYQALGREADHARLAKLLAYMRQLDADLQRGAAPPRLAFYGEVEAALGNKEAAARLLERAVNDGLTGAAFRSPLYENAIAPDRLEALGKVIDARLNAQRAELGWPPFEPPGDEG